MLYSDHREAAAYDLGAVHARAAATWVVDATRDDATYRRILTMMGDGDPRVDEYLPRRPNLSGEFVSDLTPMALVEELVGDVGVYSGDTMAEFTAAIADAYEQGVADHFEPACERELRRALGYVAATDAPDDQAHHNH